MIPYDNVSLRIIINMEKKCTRVYFTFLNGYESNYVGPLGNLARIPVDTSFVKLFTIDAIMHVFLVATSIL